MLFNSYIFLFAFLPIVLLGFHLFGKNGHNVFAIAWIVGASLFFYGWWNPKYLGLMLCSILFNYSVGTIFRNGPSKVLLVFGVTINLGALGYYKYANFFTDSLNATINSNFNLEKIILPLAISFFTFQQITYLIDAHRGKTREYDFMHYCLFVSFFPQLIAGPIVHHKEMMPQFLNSKKYRLEVSHLSVGITIFIIGLFKKVVFADNIAIHATPVFDAAETGMLLTFFEAWGGALAYTFQLYFDFSGYSDMAIGLARMFGIVLPVNFYSPYKANNIIEFWKRWHITLSRFLREYLYVPLGGNRKGQTRRYVNLMTTMLLGGLWHGAGWTFIVWGGMHGIFLLVCHSWDALKKRIPWSKNKGFVFACSILRRPVTFLVVVIAWVVFRAESLNGALSMYKGMFGHNGISLPIWVEANLGALTDVLKFMGFEFRGMFFNRVFGDSKNGIVLIVTMLAIAWFTPNTLEWLRNENPALGFESVLNSIKSKLVWRPDVTCGAVVSLIAIAAILYIQKESEFLYFQF
jgi:alginate O-acetyltransferase complex protein AlgI